MFIGIEKGYSSQVLLGLKIKDAEKPRA